MSVYVCVHVHNILYITYHALTPGYDTNIQKICESVCGCVCVCEKERPKIFEMHRSSYCLVYKLDMRNCNADKILLSQNIQF